MSSPNWFVSRFETRIQSEDQFRQTHRTACRWLWLIGGRSGASTKEESAGTLSAEAGRYEAIETTSRSFESAGGTASIEEPTVQVHDDSLASGVSGVQQDSPSGDESQQPHPLDEGATAHEWAANSPIQQHDEIAEAGKTSTRMITKPVMRRDLFT